MNRQEHWDAVYRTKAATEVSWYAAHLADSLRMIADAGTSSARVIDVGGGASTLVDDLLARGYRDVTVLDVSEAALDVVRARLGPRAAGVRWVASDVTTVDLPPGAYDVWHDRAVFHFLTEEADRRAYVAKVERSLAAEGHVVIGTFSLNGPTKCSGLDVVRYDAAGLARELGPRFTPVEAVERTHVTPGGREQSFVVGHYRLTR